MSVTADAAPPGRRVDRGTVTDVSYHGDCYRLDIASGDRRLHVKVPRESGAGMAPGQTVTLAWRPDAARLLAADDGADRHAGRGLSDVGGRPGSALATPGRPAARGWLLPAALLAAGDGLDLRVLPAAARPDVLAQPRGEGFSLAPYATLLTSPLYTKVLLTTLKLAGIATVCALLLAYPIAFTLTVAGPRLRGAILLFVLIPYWVDIIVRSFSWLILLGDNGLINKTLIGLGLIGEPLSLLYSTFSVLVAMTQILLPITIVTLFGAMLRIDLTLLSAAKIHGASDWQAFRTVFFPLSLPGVYGAGLLAFILALGFYVTPALLGSPKETMIAQTIMIDASQLLDWAQASAAGTVLLVIVVAIADRLQPLLQPRPAVGRLRAMSALAGRLGLGAAVAAIIVYLVFPVVVVVAISFSAGNFLRFPPPGLSLRWYQSHFRAIPNGSARCGSPCGSALSRR